MALVTECMKKGEFKWNERAKKSIEGNCEASGVGIGAVLMQGHKLVAYFSEKLNGAKLSSLLKEFHDIVRALNHWSHYLKPRPLGKDNVVADALSGRYIMLSIMEQRVLGFEYMKDFYASDPDFKDEWNLQQSGQIKKRSKYLIQSGFMFLGNRLCILKGSYRGLLIKEAHSNDLAGYFGV
ncbi:uncharacterized protein LOC141628265 [Silene latifolia]|uniref:uncharacterized protein LOC141628265 n=1 Tax=Silene latifolia TaxID=37657 RepID=UPI003D787B4D